MIDYLKRYQAWRRGEDERTMDEAGLEPATIGEAIDWTIERIAEIERENTDLLAEVIADPSARTGAASSDVVETMRASLARRDKLVVADALRSAINEVEVYPDTSPGEVLFDIEEMERNLRREAEEDEAWTD